MKEQIIQQCLDILKREDIKYELTKLIIVYNIKDTYK